MAPTLIAHRGYAGSAPENTVGAVEAAAGDPRTGGIEIDVQPCRDGEPVVFHDWRLDRRNDGSQGLTDAAGVVRETPVETVESATVLDSGWTVPRLESLCAALPTETFLTVELKVPDRGEIRREFGLSEAERHDQRRQWAPFLTRVEAILERFDLDVRFGSFCEAAVAEAAARGHETAPICAADDVEAAIDFADDAGCAAVHMDLESIDGGGGEFDAVSACRRSGLEVVGWTARTWHDAARMVDAGVDGVTADYPSLLDAPRRSTESASGSGGPRR